LCCAGYPLELHTVTTADGVVLQMERIPRPGCSRVAFFLHGILDTSLTWVSSGVTGSQVRWGVSVLLLCWLLDKRRFIVHGIFDAPPVVEFLRLPSSYSYYFTSSINKYCVFWGGSHLLFMLPPPPPAHVKADGL
jgi:hypothetical protein